MKKGEENDIDYTKIETQLQMQHYTHTFQVIDKTLKGKSRKAVKQYFATQIELSNIEKIYRYKNTSMPVRMSFVNRWYRCMSICPPHLWKS